MQDETISRTFTETQRKALLDKAHLVRERAEMAVTLAEARAQASADIRRHSKVLRFHAQEIRKQAEVRLEAARVGLLRVQELPSERSNS